MMSRLTSRQRQILQLMQTKVGVSNAEIRAYFNQSEDPVSRVTIVRDLDALRQAGWVQKHGAGRTVRYRLVLDNPLLQPFDPEAYFKVETDHRSILPTFNFEVFSHFSAELFTPIELQKLTVLTQTYQKNLTEMSHELIRKETERLTIELSWKSSQIEGNTYSLLDTEALIKDHREAPGHAKEEAIMILNHKLAIEYIRAQAKDYRRLSVRKIEDIHRILIQGLPGVHHGIRNRLVRIVGTNYRPLDNAHQLREALEHAVALFNAKKITGFQKALSAIILLSYIQPFVDGNKRTARLVGNAILHANQACPLSYRSIDPVDYKKAVLLFYEKNSLSYFKTLFIAQYEFSVAHYFSNGR